MSKVMSNLVENVLSCLHLKYTSDLDLKLRPIHKKQSRKQKAATSGDIIGTQSTQASATERHKFNFAPAICHVGIRRKTEHFFPFKHHFSVLTRSL